MYADASAAADTACCNGALPSHRARNAATAASPAPKASSTLARADPLTTGGSSLNACTFTSSTPELTSRWVRTMTCERLKVRRRSAATSAPTSEPVISLKSNGEAKRMSTHGSTRRSAAAAVSCDHSWPR